MDWTAIVVAIVGSGFLTTVYTDWRVRKANSKAENSAEKQMLMAMGRDRLLTLCKYYKREGEIPTVEYDSFKELSKAYFQLGGNSTVGKLIEEVDRLPLVDDPLEK